MFYKKIFLTSGMIMAITTLSAIADDVYNDDIAGQCVVGFLGGTGADNSTAPNSFQAQYDVNQYTVSAGQYLAANGITGTQCPANSFCTGGTYTFSETNDQGMTSCPTGFTLSAAGTSDENNCYHACTAADIENDAKVATVTGGTVTKGGTNTCAATCTTGYRFLAAFSDTNPFTGKESIKGTGYAAIGNSGNRDYAYGGKTQSDYNLTQNGSWGTSFSYGDITGIASCNDTAGNNNSKKWDNDSSNWSRPGNTFTQESTGLNCWCKITGYTPTGGTLQSLSSSWVFYSTETYYASNCAASCAAGCGSGLLFLDGFRSAFASVPPACVANEYTVSAGQYLAANGITGTQCPANSFCTGGTYTFSETNNQGITACPTGFTLSAAGTSDENNCYHACTAADIENGAKVATITGGTVTRGGTNTCAATCTTGYTFRAATAGTNPLSGKESIEGTDYGCQNDSRGAEGPDSFNTDKYNITEDQSWATEFSYGVIRGIASCNNTEGDHNDYTWDNDSSNWSRPGNTFTQDSTGQYCWCKITGYTPTGGTLQSLSSLWLFFDDDADFCAYDCANLCASSMLYDAAFRPALMGTASTSVPPACVANTINVTWNPANGNASTTNQCTYDGAITLPTAPEKTGYTFNGWKLVTGSSN